MAEFARHLKTGACLILLIATVKPAVSQGIIYVDNSAAGANNGQTWSDAFQNLQDALAAATAANEIWVARGVYLPDRGQNVTVGDRNARFVIPDGVALYGGFDGTESDRERRNWETNKTVLSGDLLQNDVGEVSAVELSRIDNSRQIVLIDNAVEPSTVDGFDVTSAHSDSGPRTGVRASGLARLQNLTVSRNYSYDDGGGMALFATDVCPTLADIVFEANVSEREGGGLQAYCTGQIFRNIRFINNRADQGGGLFNGGDLIVFGAIFDGNEGHGAAVYTAEQTDLLLVNAILIGNTGVWGGGIHTEDSRQTTIVNSVIAHNTALRGGGVFNLNSNFQMVNSVMAFNFATDRGGGISTWADTSFVVQIWNSTVWGNSTNGTGPQFDQFSSIGDPSPIHTRSSILDGAFPQFGNDDGRSIFEDPTFVDPDGDDNQAGTLDDDLRLMASSPGIDRGDNDLVPIDIADLDRDLNYSEPISFDLDIHERIFDAGDGHLVDIGPYEYGAPPIVLDVIESSVAPTSRIELYPNPSDHILFVTGLASQPTIGRLDVYDILGRRIHSHLLTRASTTAQLDVSMLGAGVYTIHITSSIGGRGQFGRFVLVR